MAKKITKTIKVTKYSITKGIRSHGGRCPIARACKAVGIKDLDVTDNLYFCTRGGVERTVKLPKKALKFIADFDAGLLVKPFQFNISF